MRRSAVGLSRARKPGACFALLCVACSSGSDRGSDVVVRDSGGIRIVENSGSADATPPWSVSSEPIFRVGWGDGDPQFQTVWSGYPP